MKTRNQLNANSTGGRSSTSNTSPAVQNEEVASSAPRRSSTASGGLPTRTLPRRSCIGRSNSSLLASAPIASASASIVTSFHNKSSSLSSTKTTVNHNVSTTNSTPSNTSLRKDTHQNKSASPAQVPKTKEDNDTSLIGTPPELLTTNKTANIKNYSRETPLTRSAMLPTKPPLIRQDNRITSITTTQVSKTNNKLVRISLPNNVATNGVGSGSSNDCSAAQNRSLTSIQDKNRYMFTINGLKKIGTSNAPEINLDETSISSRNNQNSTISLVTPVRPTHPFLSTQKTFNIIVGVTGSVATVKLTELIKKIKSMFQKPCAKLNGAMIDATINIIIIMTRNSKHFLPKKDELLRNLNDLRVQIYDDDDEWSLWKSMGDPVLHIELRKWADLCLIAPLDANTMAKLSNGICDNLLTCVVRAWDLTKPLVYCPAMNVHMYNHPITREQMSKLQSFGYLRVDCIEKRLACGDIGIGGMAAVDTIVNKVVDILIQPINKRSISKPLLNQQPTYPIISTSVTQESCTTSGPINSNSKTPSSIGNQILDRFRTNNQITVHAVTGSRSSKYAIDSIAAELALKRRRKMNLEESDNHTTSLNHQNKPSQVVIRSNTSSNSNDNNSNNPNGKTKMGGVTSIQNLRAISLDHNGSSECNHEVVDIDDESGFDFDPSKLLEQSMVTDDDPKNSTTLTVGSNPAHSSFDSRNSSSLGSESTARVSTLNTPLFDTPKFLALCHNKERGCFTCTICKHDYKNRKSMARHLKEQHVQGNIYQCRPCGVSYKRREKLIKHNRERHAE